MVSTIVEFCVILPLQRLYRPFQSDAARTFEQDEAFRYWVRPQVFEQLLGRGETHDMCAVVGRIDR